MFCRYCGSENTKKAKRCKNCHRKMKSNNYLLPLLVILVLIGSLGYLAYLNSDKIFTDEFNPFSLIEKYEVSKEIERAPEEMNESEIEEKSTINIIEEAQKTVYTVFSEKFQGSGFLYNEAGIIVTNAHVVEGSMNVFIKDKSGVEMQGVVIGYSNEDDVAIIHVKDLMEEEPYPLELNETAEVGEQVIALGSPLGHENTATTGSLTGIDIEVVIGTYAYENIYQISAPIAPGNSGGALVSIDTQKIIAINSAKSIESDSMGFSIPLFKVNPLIEKWIESPMDETDISNEFYNSDGSFHFGDDHNKHEVQFNANDYEEEDEESNEEIAQ